MPNEFIVRRLPPLFAGAFRLILKREGYITHEGRTHGEIARYTHPVYSSLVIESNDYLIEDHVVFNFMTPKRDPQLAAIIRKTFPVRKP